MKPCLYLSSLVVLIASLTGCMGSREGTSDYEFSTGLPVEPGYAKQLGYQTRWAHDIAMKPGQSIYSARLLDDLLIVLERPQNFVTAINVADGSLKWKAVVGHPLHDLTGVVANDKFVYVNTPKRMFKLSRHNGEQLATSDLKYRVSNRPELIDKLAIFGSTDGIVFAHDTVGGYAVWAYALKANIETPPVQSGLQVFAGDSVGYYVMLDAATGDLLWRNSTFGPITASPTVDRSFVIVASQDQGLYSFNASTGHPRWRQYFSANPLIDDPIVLGRSIYLHEQSIGFTRLDSTTGKKAWTLPEWGKAVMLTPEEDLLAIGAESLMVIEEETAKVKTRVPTRWLQEVIPGPDGSLICIAPDGDMMRIDPR